MRGHPTLEIRDSIYSDTVYVLIIQQEQEQEQEIEMEVQKEEVTLLNPFRPEGIIVQKLERIQCHCSCLVD